MMPAFAVTTVPQAQYTYGASSLLENSTFFTVFFIGAVVLLGFLLLYLLLKFIRTISSNPSDFGQVIFKVLVPKESSENASDRAVTPEQIKDQIAVAETLFANLGGQHAQRGVKAWVFGRSDHFSFEIVVQGGQIYFYVAAPRVMRDFMEQQIVAQYPEAHVEQVKDYNIFKPTSQIACGFLRFNRSYIFPIKTYRNMETDPLSAIASSLSTIKAEDGVAIQIVARSAHKRWHKKGSKVAVELHKGKKLSQALAKADAFSFMSLFEFFSPPSDKSQEYERMHTPRGLSPMEQETVKGLEEKTSKAGLDCNIRIVTSASTQAAADTYLTGIVDAFSQFNFYQYGNTFKLVRKSAGSMAPEYIYRRYNEAQHILLNAEELASIYHLPTPFLDTPNIVWLLAKKLPAPAGIPGEGLLLGENNYRGVTTPIYLQTDDRRRHTYVVGMTGTGKSALMANLAIQDIQQGHGVCVIDPHGSLVESIMPSIPAHRVHDVVYFNPSDVDRPIGLNMLEAETPEEQDFAVQEMIAIFYKLVTDPSMIGPMFEHNMRNAMLTLMADRESPGTMAEIPRMFTDKEFQKYKVSKVTDPMVRSFWEQEMAKTSDFHKSEMLGYLISKVGRFVENAMVRNIIGQPRSGFNFRDIMDNKKILLVNLAKGTTGEVNSNLLGLIIVAKLQMAALARTTMPENERTDFYLYIDEFQNFITDSISTILAEARKYKLNLILAHQYLGQLSEGTSVEGKSYGSKIRDAIFGNVGTMVSFRIGVEDAEFLAKQFAPVVSEYDLINIERFNAYVRLLVHNQPLKAFNMRSYPPQTGNMDIAKEIVEFSRWKYGSSRRTVEADILERSRLGKINELDTPVERSR